MHGEVEARAKAVSEDAGIGARLPEERVVGRGRPVLVDAENLADSRAQVLGKLVPLWARLPRHIVITVGDVQESVGTKGTVPSGVEGAFGVYLGKVVGDDLHIGTPVTGVGEGDDHRPGASRERRIDNLSEISVDEAVGLEFRVERQPGQAGLYIGGEVGDGGKRVLQQLAVRCHYPDVAGPVFCVEEATVRREGQGVRLRGVRHKLRLHAEGVSSPSAAASSSHQHECEKKAGGERKNPYSFHDWKYTERRTQRKQKCLRASSYRRTLLYARVPIDG